MKLTSALFVFGLYIVVSDAGCIPTCITRDLKITVDNIMELYIGGVQIQNLPNYNNWQKADTVPLTCNSKVIAVKGTDHGAIAGILASTDDGYIQTNSSWKCTNTYYVGWQNENFDDSTWPAAYQAAIHQTSPWSRVAGIRTDVYWIWTPRNTGGDIVVFCRKGLYVELCDDGCIQTCKARDLKITVDNIMELYIGGVQIQNLPNYNNWQLADTVLTCNSKVIAVKGTDHGAIAGILASTDDGYIQTNSSWKCTNTYHEGWQNENFDDSTWPAAYQAAIHQTSPWSRVAGIRTDVYWIWTPRNTGGDLVVFCRKSLDPYENIC